MLLASTGGSYFILNYGVLCNDYMAHGKSTSSQPFSLFFTKSDK